MSAETEHWRGVVPVKRAAALVVTTFAVSVGPAAAGGPAPAANCTGQFVVYDVIQAGAPRGASQDLAPIAQPPKTATTPPLKSDVGAASSTC
jgi:hypothetical protein